jgi:hypothetical protein
LSTDFERYGISTAPLTVRGRRWLFTVDFEAFRPGTFDQWITGMEIWAHVSARRGWKSCMFVAVEDVARLRSGPAREYHRFLAAAQEMAACGAVFYPHNHGVFDESGRMHADRPQHVPGYPKRASMFFDVVYRHRRDIGEWLSGVRGHYRSWLEDAAIQPPNSIAFRAGGWDYGADEADARAFVAALADGGFSWDSSASSGVFGERSWTVGAAFGRNVFGLASGLTEAAACWGVDGLGALHHPRTVRVLLRPLTQLRLWTRRPGVFVTVFHFNSLFRHNGANDPASVAKRVEAVFARQELLRSALAMPTASFDDLELLVDSL